LTRIFRILIALVGIFNIGIGTAFLLKPADLAARFHLLPENILGLATVRADFPALFLGAGLFALLGAWRADPEPLKVPLVLFAITLFGRTLSLVLDGFAAAAFPPMFAEVIMIVIMVGGIMAFREAAARQPL